MPKINKNQIIFLASLIFIFIFIFILMFFASDVTASENKILLNEVYYYSITNLTGLNKVKSIARDVFLYDTPLAVDILMEKTSTDEPFEYWEVVNLLKLSKVYSIDKIIDELNTDLDKREFALYCRVIKRSKAFFAKKKILSLIGKSDDWIKDYYLIYTLSEIGDSKDISYFLNFLNSEKPKLRAITIYTICKLDGINYLDDIFKGLEDTSVLIRSQTQKSIIGMAEKNSENKQIVIQFIKNNYNNFQKKLLILDILKKIDKEYFDNNIEQFEIDKENLEFLEYRKNG